jgi:hypothetical protein
MTSSIGLPALHHGSLPMIVTSILCHISPQSLLLCLYSVGSSGGRGFKTEAIERLGYPGNLDVYHNINQKHQTKPSCRAASAYGKYLVSLLFP